MAQLTAQTAEERSRFNKAVSYTLSRITLSNIELKREHLAAIRFLYFGKDIFLWLPTGFEESVYYKVSLFLFDFAVSSSRSFCSLLSSDSAAIRQYLHTYEGKLSPSMIANNSSWLRCPGRSSLNGVVLNNAEAFLGAMSDKQIWHLLRLPTTFAHTGIASQ